MTETVKQVLLTVERNVWISAPHPHGYHVHSPGSQAVGSFPLLDEALLAAYTVRIMLALQRLGMSGEEATAVASEAYSIGEFKKGTSWQTIVRRALTDRPHLLSKR